MAEKRDLFVLIEEKCTADQIAAILQSYKKKEKNVRVSGKKGEIVEHLKDAISEKIIPKSEAIDLLRECEENGDQHIFYFVPKAKKNKELCADGQHTADLLFPTPLDRMGFPLFQDVPDEHIWSDFRVVSTNGRSGWVGKIYGHESALEFESEEEHPNYLIKKFVRNVERTVCLVRWNPPNLLEIRVPRVESRAKLDERLKRVWIMIRPALKQEDFSPWDTRKARCTMVKERKDNSKLYHLPTVYLTDPGSGKAIFAAYTEDGSQVSAKEREAAIDLLMKGKTDCDRLVVVWCQVGAPGTLISDLRTIVAPRYSNELVIPARVNSQTVDYVTDRLREFDA